ncbi:hypothetical protein [uncultured Piscinibacter sp.]|uniref:hypothetical protein n=1 Tax=uncultured Piscinibacter sp. TaxID=1131835 RepID=UPI002621DD8C|nr:hypothetical protein [uncultured Piscinibacter sp.]
MLAMMTQDHDDVDCGVRRQAASALEHRALLTMPAVVRVAVVPFALVTASLAREASGVYEKLQSGEWNPAQYLRGAACCWPRRASASCSTSSAP